MEFLKKHWSTLLLIGAFAAYIGISMGTNNCPLCVAGSAIGRAVSDKEVETAPVAIPPAAWEISSIDNQPIRSQDYAGKVTLMVYWATWCGPCRDEIPDLIALRNDYSEERLGMIGVTGDPPSKTIDEFVKKTGMNYTIAFENESLMAALGTPDFYPTILVLNKRGEIASRFEGATTFDVVRAAIEAQLTLAKSAGI